MDALYADNMRCFASDSDMALFNPARPGNGIAPAIQEMLTAFMTFYLAPGAEASRAQAVATTIDPAAWESQRPTVQTGQKLFELEAL